MMGQLTLRLRRLLAIALLGVVFALAWFGLVSPIWSYLDERDEQRGIELRALRRDRALLQEQPAVQAALDSVQHSARWQNFYSSPKPEAATLEMEGDLREIFKGSNNPTSMAADHPASLGAVTRITVRVALSMRMDQLAEALDHLQRQSRHLEVSSLIIQAPDFQPADSNPTLTIQAEITGFSLPPDGPT
jgi:hypothetical protein